MAFAAFSTVIAVFENIMSSCMDLWKWSRKKTAIINAISYQKDVDAFHPTNVGKIMIGEYSFLPCTPAGVMDLIASTGVEISGKNCVVV